MRRNDIIAAREKNNTLHGECESNKSGMLSEDGTFHKGCTAGKDDVVSKNDELGEDGVLPKSATLNKDGVLSKGSALGSSLGITYGYARVSAKDQNLDRQLDALVEFPIDPKRIYSDKASGKDFERPRYKTLLRRLKPNDVVVIKSIDRLGRNYNEILEQWRIITKEKRAHIVVLDIPLLDTRHTTNGITGIFLADIVLQLLSCVAQVERENIKQRQAEGIAAAKARGVKFGRPAIKRPSCYTKIRQEYEKGTISREQAAKQLHICVRTFDKWIKYDRELVS